MSECCEWGVPGIAVMPDPVTGQARHAGRLLPTGAPAPAVAPGGSALTPTAPAAPGPAAPDAPPAQSPALPKDDGPGDAGYRTVRPRLRGSVRDGSRHGRTGIVPAEPAPEVEDEEMPWLNTTIALTVAEWPESPEPWAGDIELDEPEGPPEE